LRSKKENIQLRESLNQSEGMLKTLIQTLPDLVWLKDQEGVFLSCNPMFEKYFGASEAEIIGKTDYDFVSRELADFFRENDRKAMAAGKPTMNEEWITFADGRRVLLETIKTPMYDGQNNLIGILGIGHDITRRKRNEEALKEKEETFRALFEQAGDYTILIQPTLKGDLLIVDANRAALKVHGYTRDEIIGKSILELDVGTKNTDLILERLLSGETVKFETLHRRKDDSLFPVEVTVKCVKIEGKPPLFISTEHDLTEAKKNEEILIKAKEQAESSDRLKSAFLATMSHELRTPLNSIIGFSSILLQERAGPLTEEQKKQMKMIKSSGTHLLSLINEILDLSKIESGQVIPKPEIFILNEILQEVVNLEEPNASQKGILLKLEDDQPLEMNSDKQRIQQIILNLVNNAIKFTDEGSVTIGFYRENSNVRINITDTGIGIKEEDSIKLFKPFIQIESHLARKYQGSGLGLSISKKLAELLGGSIDLKSEFG
jgi:PAS domain S-box-containing protein